MDVPVDDRYRSSAEGVYPPVVPGDPSPSPALAPGCRGPQQGGPQSV